MDQYIGKMLDNRYEILECIGTGGMAVVYKARCHRLNRLVAVKILKPELAQDAEFRRRFHDESQAVAMLSHTNIVAVYDVSQSDGLDYIVMELVDGMTLKQYMRKRGAPLNWRESLHFITQIVRALSHAHSRGIVHRDIKPQNILVLRDGSCKVTDFGIARVASAAQSTLTQEALGSVHYISPEQARGSHIDGRSDIYSAGVVLYEMLTGRLPFEGETPVSVAIQHINSIPIPPRDLVETIPPALEAIVLKAMAPKPESRYASADEMLAELEEFRKNPDVVPPAAQQAQEDAAVSEPTRAVPVTEIKQVELRTRRPVSSETPAHATSRTPAQQPNRTRTRRPAERSSRYSDEDDYDDLPRRGGSALPYLIAVVAILLFIGGMFYFVYNLFFSGSTTPPVAESTDIKVPNLTFYTWEQLEQDSTLYEGFTLNPQYREDSRTAGTILSQDPEGGTMIKETDSKIITLMISSGGEQPIVVPELEDKTWAEASAELWGMGLNPVSRTEYSDTIEEEHVIRTSPLSGSSVRKGETITVILSMGAEKVPTNVPDLMGKTLDRAKTMAERAGLVVVEDILEVESDESKGTVVYQSPKAETTVDKGTEIEIWISLGPAEPSPSPSVEPTASPDPDSSTSPDVEPSNTAAVDVFKAINVDLSPFKAKDSVHIRIIVGDLVVKDETVGTNVESYSVLASGTGVQRVEIYIDNELFDAYPLDFS